jgi:hypothetical protein
MGDFSKSLYCITLSNNILEGPHLHSNRFCEQANYIREPQILYCSRGLKQAVNCTKYYRMEYNLE